MPPEGNRIYKVVITMLLLSRIYKILNYFIKLRKMMN
jgi:hypothetical protein